MTSATTFGARLRLARKLRGFKRQQDFADAAEVALKTVNRHETAEKAPSARASITAYLKVLNVPELWLVHGVGDGPQLPAIPPSVEQYLANPPFDTPIDPEVERLLIELEWSTVGAPDPTLEEVHSMKKMLEALVQSRRQRSHGDHGGEPVGR